MAMTPEGRVKKLVRDLLSQYPRLYSYWPVSNGMSAPSLDVIGCVGSMFFAVETKTAGNKPNPRQLVTMQRMEMAGATVFVIAGEDPSQLVPLRLFLDLHHDHALHFPSASKVGGTLQV